MVEACGRLMESRSSRIDCCEDSGEISRGRTHFDPISSISRFVDSWKKKYACTA